LLRTVFTVRFFNFSSLLLLLAADVMISKLSVKAAAADAD
jgi:hypothetical protein